MPKGIILTKYIHYMATVSIFILITLNLLSISYLFLIPVTGLINDFPLLLLYANYKFRKKGNVLRL